MSLTTILMGQSFFTASGQEPTKCKTKDKSLRAVQYRIGRFERSPQSTERPSTLIVDISVKPELIDAKYMVLLAHKLNQTFCKEDRLVVGIFDKYEIAVRFRDEFQDALDAFRGEYVLDRKTGKEYVSFSLVPDYQGNPESRIKIDLTAGQSSCVDPH